MRKKTKNIICTFLDAQTGKSLLGKVISNKMQKTIVVQVTRLVKHPLYGKVIKVFKKYKAHDAQNKCNTGDIVEIVETRPLSKTKHMALKRIVEKVS